LQQENLQALAVRGVDVGQQASVAVGGVAGRQQVNTLCAAFQCLLQQRQCGAGIGFLGQFLAGQFRGVDTRQPDLPAVRQQQGVAVECLGYLQGLAQGRLKTGISAGQGLPGKQANKKGETEFRPFQRPTGCRPGATTAQRPYLRRNLSTRPAVSTIFCFPV
jgi:hypothetical protein